MPLFYFKIFSLKLKILFFKTHSANSASVQEDISFSSLSSSLLLRADNPSSCGILRYKPTTFIVPNKIMSGEFAREQRFFRKSFESLIYDLTFLAIGCKWKSKNEEIFSVYKYPQLEITAIPGTLHSFFEFLEGDKTWQTWHP